MSLDDRLRRLSVNDVELSVEQALAGVRARSRRVLLVRRTGLAAAFAFAAAVAAIAAPRLLGGDEISPLPFAPAPTPTEPTSTEPTSTPTEPTPTPSWTPFEPEGTVLIGVDDGDLWLYDVSADESRRLTADGEQRRRGDPTFVDDSRIVYPVGSPPAIEILDLAGGDTRTLVQERSGGIADIDVSPDGSTILYLHHPFGGDAPADRLKKVEVVGGRPSVLRSFSTGAGTGGGGSEGELSVAWSPDGRSILVTDTLAEQEGSEQEGSIFLLDRQGRDLFSPWTGTHARWSPDGRTIYYRGYAGRNGQAWYAFDVHSRTRTELDIRPGTNNPAISPDGRYIAYDTSYYGEYPREARVSGQPPVVYLYDLEARRETRLRTGALTPVWISATEVLVADATEPAQPSLNSWDWVGTASRMTIDGGRTIVDFPGPALWGADVLHKAS